MSKLSFLGTVLFAIACLAVGMRLLLLARRTHKLPELLMGFALISGGCLGNSLNFVVDAGFVTGPGALFVLGAARFLIGGATLSALVAAWWIFRRDEPWAGVLVGVFATLLAPYFVSDFWFASSSPEEVLRHPSYWGWTLARIGSYTWMSVESLNSQLQLRRRWSVGLAADRVLASRMLMWGLGNGSIAAMFVTIAVYQVLEGDLATTAAMQQIIASLGLVTAICLWLAFFPPQGYLRRLETRTSSEAA